MSGAHASPTSLITTVYPQEEVNKHICDLHTRVTLLIQPTTQESVSEIQLCKHLCPLLETCLCVCVCVCICVPFLFMHVSNLVCVCSVGGVRGPQLQRQVTAK